MLLQYNYNFPQQQPALGYSWKMRIAPESSPLLPSVCSILQIAGCRLHFKCACHQYNFLFEMQINQYWVEDNSQNGQDGQIHCKCPKSQWL